MKASLKKWRQRMAKLWSAGDFVKSQAQELGLGDPRCDDFKQDLTMLQEQLESALREVKSALKELP